MTYQFKIQLKESKNPEVWRRVTILSNCSFLEFHKVIAVAFDREQNNLSFAFSPSGKGSKPQIISLEHAFNSNLSAKKTSLSSIFKRQEQTYTYLPEFDGKWLHDIVLEKVITQKIPHVVCLAGEGAYPPETCTNPEDYEEMKLALSDKNHPQHKSTQEWLELDENETWEEKYKFDISKVNEQLMCIDDRIKSFRNYTIVKHDTFNEKYDLNPSLWKIIDKQREEVYDDKNWNKIFRDAEKSVREYPNIPHFKNTLAIACLKANKKERAYEMLQQLLAEYPDYVIARCNLANQYTDNNRLDKAIEMLGGKFDLSELYPDRNGDFTEVEIYNYHIAVFRYFLKIKNDNDAQKHLDFLESLFPDEIHESDFQMQLNLVRMKKTSETITQEKTVKVIPERIAPTNKAPDFENPEMKILYEQSVNIKRDILQRIMKLPRESVIKDLEKILIDSIARFDYFRKNTSIDIPDAPIHALYLLSALEAEEALDTFFSVLRQDEDYYDFWYGDILTEDFWLFTYMMGQNQLDRLKDFVFEPNRYTYVRSAVNIAVMHIAFHQKERKEEVIKWYEEVLQYMLDYRNDDNIFESDAYLHCLEDMIDVAGKEHLPLILRLYDESLVSNKDRFSLYEIKKLLVRCLPGFKIRDIYTSIDQYYDHWQSWFGENNFDSDNKSHFLPQGKPSMPLAAVPKVGRNDTCPCGSGKKYKKCCGANK